MADEPLQVTVRPDDAITLPADPWAQFGQVATMKPPAAAQAAQGADPWGQFGSIKTPSGVVEDVLKSGVAGIGKGLIGLGGAPGDLAELGQKGVDYLAPPPAGIPRAPVAERLPNSPAIRKEVEKVTGPFHEAETPLGHLADTTGELIPGVMAVGGAGGAAGIGGRIAQGVRDVGKFAAVPGVASEVAGGAVPEPAKPYVRTGAALVAGAGAAALTRPGTPLRALKNQLPDYVEPMHVVAAGDLIRDAQTMGITLTWPEALSQITGRPVLTDTQRLLESSKQTRGHMQETLGGRPQEVEGAARAQMGAVAPVPANPNVIGPQAGRAADEALNDVRDIINAHAQPFYDMARTTRLSPQEFHQAMAMPGVPEAIQAIRNHPHLGSYVQGLPDDTIGMMNEVKKYLDNAAKNERSPIQQGANAQVAGSMERSAARVRQLALDAETRVNPARPAYQTALATEEVGRAQYLEPLMQGSLGRLASHDITTQRAIEALFPKSPLTHTENDVDTAVSALVQRNPVAARALVRAHLEWELEKAFNAAGRGQEAAQFAGARFAHNVAGSPVINTQRMGNLRVAVEALPNGPQIWDGLDRMFEVMQATGTRQAIGSKTAFNASELQSLETGSAAANVAKIGASPGKWLTVAKDLWGSWQAGKNLDAMARIITDPQSGPIFERLARMPPNSSELPRLMARLVAIGESARKPTEQPKQAAQ